MIKPTTHQRDLAKLPRALAPLIERDQWAVWKWTQRPDGSWQKPPFQARDPQRHASTSDPDTWADYLRHWQPCRPGTLTVSLTC